MFAIDNDTYHIKQLSNNLMVLSMEEIPNNHLGCKKAL